MMGILVALMAQVVYGAAPNQAEMDEAHRWAAAKFQGVVEQAAPKACIQVLANNDPVQINSRGGKPMKIVDKQYTRGLYCHAVSKLVVTLPKPGKTFEAVVGVDSNEQTSGGRGSVVFSVSAGGKDLWHSPVMHEGIAGLPVKVDLAGATEFVLEVGDAGDGISCDQSDWADAQVRFADGTNMWLADLPLEGQQRQMYDRSPFFSFNYDGKPSTEFLSGWKLERAIAKLDENRTQHTLTYFDPKSGLVVRCVGVAYHDFPTVEWTLHFKNTGTADTPILSDIQAIDSVFQRNSISEYVLHRNKGDDCSADSFEPIDVPLPAKKDLKLANTGGRPTQITWPYFNIESAPEGMIFVVSWAGQWSAQFTRDDGNGLRLRAGQELTHFKLEPGEEIRTPMIVLQFYRGDKLRAQNIWRAWMIAHNLPRPGGKLPPLPQLNACSSHQFGEMIHADTASQLFFIDHYLERGLKLDYWWMDAGWYLCDGSWPKTGTWEVDEKRFPGGFRPITDHAHAKGVNIIVWFEPERVAEGTWLTENHPDWIFGGAKGGLLKLGEPEPRQWLTDHVDKLLTEQGIDLYRQDFNIDPLKFWRQNDTEDRQGITEIRHVEGYFAYWDELRRRHPNMLIDSCASGGRRNDLETLRRAVPLLRSDYIMEPIGNQCHTYTLASWFPFFGTGSSKTDTYLIRSTLCCPSYTACWDQRDDKIDWANIKRIVDIWKATAPNYFGDFYPLTAYSLRDTDWIGWQFDRPEAGEGMLQVFRRADCPYTAAKLPLHGLDEKATYTVTDLDTGKAAETSGEQLAQEGLPITIDGKPGEAFLTYKKK